MLISFLPILILPHEKCIGIFTGKPARVSSYRDLTSAVGLQFIVAFDLGCELRIFHTALTGGLREFEELEPEFHGWGHT